jgi:phenylalanyl-tRNA synthetase alpha chain
MLDKIQEHIEEIEQFISDKPDEIEHFRLKYLGQKGLLKEYFSRFKDVPGEQKKLVGQKINELKQSAENKIAHLADKIRGRGKSESTLQDFTLPGDYFTLGHKHPISIVKAEIIDIFKRVGFTVSEGPEVEDDWHNFSALNFPPDHPARDMQDTFFVEKNPDVSLRTHTSSVQIRVMEGAKPPFRTISPGRVYRNEAISARAHCFFHQVEGLYIDQKVSLADLKQTLLYFSKEMFGEKTNIRLRPSYFPFTEPSAEMDITCFLCSGKGCNICKYSGWVEILGCGMVDPNVLKNNNIDSEKYNGYAFGMGVERIAMLKYQINDIRLFFENDVRFLKQFND